MIYLTIKGRLGNQLFQYAFARALKEKTGMDIIIDWHHVINSDKIEPGVGFENSLRYFNVCDFRSIDVSEYKKHMGLTQYLAFRKYEKNFPFNSTIEEKQKFEIDFLSKNKSKGLLFFENGYYNFEGFKETRNIFLNGYYESTKYFNNIEEVLKREFTPIHSILEHNIPLYEDIIKSESVCVTIRRGDFVGNSFHEVCNTDYFLRGMDVIHEKVPNAKFFIFSNDVDWLRKNVCFKYPVVFEQGNDPVWEKLRLMYSCKHFVISNSTFSWWAQYLSRNKNKVVVAPNRWYNSTVKSDLLTDEHLTIL